MMPTHFDGAAPIFVAPSEWRQETPGHGPLWGVAALIEALSDLIAARLNPVRVKGEVSAFSRAASGHCYFTLKDVQGQAQIRCAMFKRLANALDFTLSNGDLVEVSGKLSIYDARGDLQLIVESVDRAGQGNLFEQFMQLKARLEAQGLFDPSRKRPIPAWPRRIGLVTSPGAAALHDVTTTLSRRIPHVPVLFSPAAVQGAGAPKELMAALEKLSTSTSQPVDVILLVRGGGSMDDLWAFNDEGLVHAIARSAVPVICGVGHETDFTLADFAADLRAPTPTAAAELCATPRHELLARLVTGQGRLLDVVESLLDRHQLRLDKARTRLGRPAQNILRLQMHLDVLRLKWQTLLRHVVQGHHRQHLHRLERLALLDPALVLQRGYAWLHADGQAIGRVALLEPGQAVTATLADGEVDLRVLAKKPD
jgi:exodeoxyribonuclease VII large subunit